jgi:hypothetical protein
MGGLIGVLWHGMSRDHNVCDRMQSIQTDFVDRTDGWIILLSHNPQADLRRPR